MKLIANLKDGLQELILRWKEPLNTFWRRMLACFLLFASVCAAVTDVLPLFLNDDIIPEEYKVEARMLYSFCAGIVMAARLTTANQMAFKEKKAQAEFKEKLNA